MQSKYFPNVTDRISYEGKDATNPLAFRYYQPDRIVAGKRMDDHLRFAVSYWHTFRGTGADPFGGGVYSRPWGNEGSPLERAESTLEAMFEFTSKLNANYYCFHDRDIAPEGETISETNKNLEHIVGLAKKHQDESGVKLLWGTANLFSHPRYTHGASTNPDPKVVAHAAAQVRRALDATVELGGRGYVFWGGREGYSCLLNTKLQQEREQLASFLHMAVEYGKSIGFKGTYLIEPKPMEPTTHQYDFDAATCLSFLREFDLLDSFKLNIEANHATLAGHSFEHELMTASDAGCLGSIDINRGHPSLGWDTDQFPTHLYDAVMSMYIVSKQGGLDCGLNFDAKVRRGSFDTEDLFHAHIGGMDNFAQGLLIANRMIEDKALDSIIEKRYEGFKSEMGEKILTRNTSLPELEKWASEIGEPTRVSGREERIENLMNQYLHSGIE